MISPDTVLTAAHCIHSGTTDGRPFSNFRFFPGRNVAVAPFGECGAIGARVLRGWVNAPNQLDARIFDLGAFKLDCRVGDITGHFAIRTMGDTDVGLGTTVFGYAVDKAPGGRQWKSTDELRLLHDLKGFYDNDTYGGTSGSAVFISGQENEIVGVHTNGLHGEYPWSTHNAFTRITKRRFLTIQEWISH